MIIKKIEINNFGCLTNRVFEFSDSFNLISGDNESGKSTLLSFIIYAFYGTKVKKSPTDMAFKDKYMPWNGMPMNGKIFFVYNNMDYVVSRLTSEYQNELTLFCISKGEEIKDRSILSSPGRYFFGVGAEEMYRSIFISSYQSASLHMSDAGIISGLSGLYDTGSINLSYTHISEILKDRISNLNSTRKKNAVIPTLNNDIMILKSKISNSESDTSKILELKKKSDELKKQIDLMENECNLLKETAQTDVLSKKGKHTDTLFIVSFVCTLISLVIILLKPVEYFFYIASVIFVVTLAYTCFMGYKTFLNKKEYERKVFTLQINNDKIILLTDKIYKFRTEYTMLLEQIKVLRQNIDGNDGYNEKLSELENKLNVHYTTLEALQLAADVLDRAFSDCSLSYVSRLSELTGEYLSDISSGNYSNALVDEGLNLTVDSENGYRNVLSVSNGAREQSYLSLRLALSDMLFSSEESPLFLDDALAFYDEKRCRLTLDLLFDISHRKQIFFSTCRKNECDYLQEKGVKVIEI